MMRHGLKILAVSDRPEKALWDYFQKGRWSDIDLVLSCGDLNRRYLEFLVTMLSVPVFYVRGNHDARYEQHPPEGCDDIHGKLVRYGGLRFLGFEGSYAYGPGKVGYTERQMAWKVWKKKWALRRAGGVDVVVSHAPPVFCDLARTVCDPPAGLGKPCRFDLPDVELCHEATDHVHRGFCAFTGLIRDYQPKVFVHGHIHLSYGLFPREGMLRCTRVINAFGYHIIEV